MDSVDMDTNAETDTDTAQDQQPSTADQDTSTDAPANAESTETVPYKPFGKGKEKFKVNGQELEWDWETTKRYAQIGRSGQMALERAATTEKKARQFYDQLVSQAAKDPDGLIEILTGRKVSRAQAQHDADPSSQQDPRDSKISQLEERLAKFEQGTEQAAIEKERLAIQSELDAASKKYPEIDDEITRDYVKAQYAKMLRNAKDPDDVTMDDVAFHVAQMIKDNRAKKTQDTKKRLDETRRRSPVSSSGIPAGGEGGHKPMTLEDVKKLAGRMG